MATPFPSDAWIKALKDRLNHNAAYAEAAKNWEGDLYFQVDYVARAPALLYVDLWHGHCRDAFAVTETEAAPKAAFRLSASMENFIKVLTSELDPIRAMVTGKIKVQGNMVMMMKNIPAVLEFVRTAQQIETEFLV